MTIQIYAGKGFDTQKAERFFKERKTSVQRIDALKFGVPKRVLEGARASLGMDALIDRKSTAFLESPYRFSLDEDRLFDYAAQNAKVLHLPIVRMERNYTVGYCPDIWKNWL